MNNPDHISESLETIFWVKNTSILLCGSGIRGGKIRIRDPLAKTIFLPFKELYLWEPKQLTTALPGAERIRIHPAPGVGRHPAAHLRVAPAGRVPRVRSDFLPVLRSQLDRGHVSAKGNLEVTADVATHDYFCT
jgi:hypothetical protein